MILWYQCMICAAHLSSNPQTEEMCYGKPNQSLQDALLLMTFIPDEFYNASDIPTAHWAPGEDAADSL